MWFQRLMADGHFQLSTFMRWVGAAMQLALLLSAAAVAGALAASSQVRDLYIAQAEDPQWQQIVAALTFLGMISAMLVVAYAHFANIGKQVIYSSSGRVQDPPYFGVLRMLSAWLIAIAPWAGVVFGLWFAAGHLEETERLLQDMQLLLSSDRNVASAFAHGEVIQAAAALIQPLKAAAYGAAALGVVVVAVLLTWRRRLWFQRAVTIVSLISVALLMAAPSLFNPSSESFVAALFWLGPLTSPLLVTFVLLCLIVGVIWLSRATGVSTFALLMILVGLFMLRGWAEENSAAAVERLGLGAAERAQAIEAAPGDKIGRVQAASERTVQQRFEDWLRARRNLEAFRREGRPYPVFVISARGGGIYAAELAATFLGRLQDTCPHFSQHVFAISGVSGGAVGSTLFHALTSEKTPSIPAADATCALLDGPKPDGIEARARDALQQSHLSPILAALPSDYFRKLVDSRPRGAERGRVLAEGFRQGVAGVGAPQATAWLDTPFIDHWDPASRLPALVLNTTWVETGRRVAFAPFSLRPVGDGTLWAFSDLTQLCVEMSYSDQFPRLIDAAVHSARFPGVMSAHGAPVAFDDRSTAAACDQAPTERRRWNFVDGGYADASGASTARAITESIIQTPVRSNDAESLPLFEVNLIVLKEFNRTLDPNFADGTLFRDTLAPLNALLNIRQLLSTREVLRAEGSFERETEYAEIKRAQTVALNAPFAPEDAVVNTWDITLDIDRLQLPLGWTLSDLNARMIELAVGLPSMVSTIRRDPSDCVAEYEQRGVTRVQALDEAEEIQGRQREARATTGILVQNACTMARLVQILSPRP